MTIRKIIYALSLMFVLAASLNCYSFRGVSIDPNVNTFYVDDFELATSNAPITLSQDFSEALRDKIRLETRLTLTDTDPDIEFSGAITGYDVTSMDPQPGEFTALNRLQIRIRVEYVSNKKRDDKWQETFSFFEDFPATQNLIDVEESLVNAIFDQITEDIFNRAFSNW
jgi:hypothetical protein